jgi:hypothetical protein
MAFPRQGPQDIAVGRPCRFDGVEDDLNDRPDPPTTSSGGRPDIGG